MSPQLAHEAMLKGMLSFGDEIDGTHRSMVFPLSLSLGSLSKVKLPGKELSANDFWQVDERELMTTADYDDIINRGYGVWLQEYFRDRLDNIMEKLKPYFAFLPQAMQQMTDAGLPVLMPVSVSTFFEPFIGGRSMSPFIRDLFKIPDKVQAAGDVAMEYILENLRTAMRNTKPIGVFIGHARQNREFISQKMQERFVYPYILQIINTVLEEGGIPVLHCDGNWEQDFAFFKLLPKGKCLLQLDGSTNIYKAKETVGDWVCIYGDVSPALLTVGTPKEVYNYCQKLIKEIGPSGFILGQGCDTPPNAKPENVRAMYRAIANQ
jgi:hypothetical protein